MYVLENVLIAMEWVICFVALWFIPKYKRREASFIFLNTQFLTWIFGLIVVEAGWIEYPVRLFPKANSTSFTFEYLFLPFICIFFNFYYPQDKKFYRRVLYYVIFLSIFTVIEFFVEKYTMMITYFHWRWYWTWISMFLTIYIIRTTYKWFFRMGTPFKL